MILRAYANFLMAGILAASLCVGWSLTDHADGMLPQAAHGVSNDPGHAAAKWSNRVHDIIGTVVLVAGAFAFCARKGGWLHIKAGRVFAYSMAALAVSVVPMLITAPSALQVMLMGLALYLTVSGILIARQKVQDTVSLWGLAGDFDDRHSIRMPKFIVLESGCALSLIGICLASLCAGGKVSFSTSYADVPANLLAFLGLVIGINDLVRSMGERGFASNNQRIGTHVIRMTGAFALLLAAGFFNICAAFHLLHEPLRWLIPAATLAPAVVLYAGFTMRSYAQKSVPAVVTSAPAAAGSVAGRSYSNSGGATGVVG